MDALGRARWIPRGWTAGVFLAEKSRLAHIFLGLPVDKPVGCRARHSEIEQEAHIAHFRGTQRARAFRRVCLAEKEYEG